MRNDGIRTLVHCYIQGAGPLAQRPASQASLSPPQPTILSAVRVSLPEFVIRQVSSFSAFARTNSKQGQHRWEGCMALGGVVDKTGRPRIARLQGKRIFDRGHVRAWSLHGSFERQLRLSPPQSARERHPSPAGQAGHAGPGRLFWQASGCPGEPGCLSGSCSTSSSCCMGPREDPNEPAGKRVRGLQVSPTRERGSMD